MDSVDFDSRTWCVCFVGFGSDGKGGKVVGQKVERDFGVTVALPVVVELVLSVEKRKGGFSPGTLIDAVGR